MQSLIKAAQAGDLEAYGPLIEQYSGMIERFAYQIGVPFDDVPDVSQEVFLKIYRYMERFDGESFNSWVYKITLNVARDYARKQTAFRKKEKRLVANQELLNTESVEAQILHDEENQHLYQCIIQLKEKYRIPIVLYFFQDMTYKEISEILGIKLSTVKVRVMRGKRQLAEMLSTGTREGGVSHG